MHCSATSAEGNGFKIIISSFRMFIAEFDLWTLSTNVCESSDFDLHSTCTGYRAGIYERLDVEFVLMNCFILGIS